MRSLSFVLAGAAIVGACATMGEPVPVERSARAEAHLQQLIAGRTPGRSLACLPSYRADRMTVIDENTVLFRDGGTVYRTAMNGSCARLGDPGYAMLTRQAAGGSLCRGEIAQVIDTGTGMIVGACSFGDFVPYSRIGS